MMVTTHSIISAEESLLESSYQTTENNIIASHSYADEPIKTGLNTTTATGAPASTNILVKWVINQNVRLLLVV